MANKRTLERALQAEEEGKAPSTQAAEFVREEIENIRQEKHGTRSTKQAIAIGLSKARRAGVKLRPPGRGTVSEATRRKAEREYEKAQAGEKTPPSPKRARAKLKALRRESGKSVSKESLSEQTRSAAHRRTQADRFAGGDKGGPDALSKQPERSLCANKWIMSTDDYPGPSDNHPEKEGQDPRGRADEEMVKPSSRPKAERKKKSPSKMGDRSHRP
jgi:Family of unknown function (DUF6496)